MVANVRLASSEASLTHCAGPSSLRRSGFAVSKRLFFLKMLLYEKFEREVTKNWGKELLEL